MAFLNVLSAVCLWLIVTTVGGLILLPFNRNVLTASLLFFNNLNIFIAYCEIALGVHILHIQEDYRILKKKYKGNEWECGLAFLTMPLPDPFDSRAWSRMWSTYALYDPSYQNQESFGFFIDFGNGMSTIPPCLLWNYAMAFPEKCSPLLVGCIGIASYWQVMYGTIIYLLSYIFNRRYEGKTLLENVGFVGFANSLWFFFPIAGLYASTKILESGDFSVFER